MEAKKSEIISGIGAIAAELSISYNHARNCLMAGKIPARRLGETWLTSRTALHLWASGQNLGLSTLDAEPSKKGPGRPRKQSRTSSAGSSK